MVLEYFLNRFKNSAASLAFDFSACLNAVKPLSQTVCISEPAVIKTLIILESNTYFGAY